ncbi:hypothetical protein GCM10022280_04050 [Sphingomonas swuensis]|uniref:Uncharacterized protein n=1 Tax=Sphingomonas swuensis TaxID=977800 RepID=A0ABP7SCY8_9SPHN
MVTLQVIAGVVVSLVMDWSIYTQVSVFLPIRYPKWQVANYAELSKGSPLARIRTLTVILAGGLGGLSFSFRDGSLWLVTFGVFAIAHVTLYILLYRQPRLP